MRTSVVGLFALPATLFFVIFTPVNGQDWPYNLPAGAKYYPEHEHHIRRDLEIQQRLNVASPSGIRKMSEDEGEKFFLDYWQRICIDRYNHYYTTNNYRDYWSFLVNVV
ncbi:hypothetical protein JADG_003411 [Aureobasidium aubasidani]|nr:hypothetical protein JADG_003411 [Aureobasidium pullulans]